MTSATHANETVPLFAGTIQIVGLADINCRPAYGANLAPQNLLALIGRDILNMGVLIANGPEGTISFAI